MPAPPLLVQTIYAELLERCAAAAFDDAFPEEGVFVVKIVKGRRYWYFQTRSGATRAQRYAGIETPELLDQIERHRSLRDDERQRRALVSALVRSLGLPRPIPAIGNVIEALARAGVFRLRCVLVGTVAYQAYMGMLGVRFPSALLQTADIDIAQLADVSVAVKDSTRPVFDVLTEVDDRFRPVPAAPDGRHSTSYLAADGIRVDFLTPARGPDVDKPQMLSSLKTEAQPLRFLDFLIYDSQPAAILHGSGIYVQVPAPERYAVHKLIVSRRRPKGSAKSDKDIHQAEVLIDALEKKRPFELKSAWEEAYSRGPHWRLSLSEGIAQIAPRVRDLLLKIIGLPRSFIVGMDLTFDDPVPQYDFHRDAVAFAGDARGQHVACAISRSALEDHFGADGGDEAGFIQIFKKNRSTIEQLARTIYLRWAIEEPNTVLIKSRDILMLSEHPPRPASDGTPVIGLRRQKKGKRNP